VGPDPAAPTTDLEKEAALVPPIGLFRLSRSRAGVLASVLVGAGITLGWLTRDPAAARIDPPAEHARVEPQAPVAAREAPELARVVISFAVTPPSATIEIDGRPQHGSLVVD